MSRIAELQKKVESGFLGFWVRKYRISYLVVLLILVLGIIATIAIPKESSPAIKLGIISITTVYPGTNPEDIDSLISDKIYKEIKDINGINKITSSSSLGVSGLSLELKTSANTKDVLAEVRNKVSKVVLPTDAKTPVVTEIETDTNRAFSVLLYDTTRTLSRAGLIDRAITLQNALKNTSGVDTVDLSVSTNGSPVSNGGSNSADYDVYVVIPREKLSTLGLTLSSIATTIRASNMDQPIGNFAIGDKKYDFRIVGKNKTSLQFLDTAITLPNGSNIRLGDIATIERRYKDNSIKELIVGSGSESYPYIGLTINKLSAASIFSATKAAKQEIEQIMQSSDFTGMRYVYSYDLADTISDDYGDLMHEAMVTIILVFFAMYLFVGFRDSLFATLTLPLAFLSTFIILYYLGYSLNFLTNFSLILSFGIAVDTIIVIVQAASAKLRVGYEPRTAIMLALREYAAPIIAGVSTTIVVFIPMMTLPGIMGKFLAYIPITIFGVLACGLILALTVNSALYLLFVKRKKTYIEDETTLEHATLEERELLDLERAGKDYMPTTAAPLRIRVIHRATEWYKHTLRRFLENTRLRRVSIVLPFLFFIVGFIFFAPRIGFELFPGDDNNLTNFTIQGPVGIETEVMQQQVSDIATYFTRYPEVKLVTISTSGNKSRVAVELTKKKTRKSLGQRGVWDLEKEWMKRLSVYETKGLKVTNESVKGGPPSSKAVGVKLIASNVDGLQTLIATAHKFEDYIKTVPGTKNVTISSQDTPGQFIFRLKKDLLALYGIPSNLITSTITTNMNGVTVGSIEDNGNDMDIVLKTDTFLSGAKMEDIMGLPFVFGTTTYKVGNFITSETDNAIASVVRENGKIQIAVESDLEAGYDTVGTQAKLVDYAKQYSFPKGISYQSGGENQENSALIIAVMSSFFIALVVIFAILTFQFNSFSQPLIILYSVIMALPFVMIGLLVTGNQFSMPFAIGFIAFTGIAVNHGIILIDAINQNLERGMNGFTALVEAGSSRLEPMTLTTVTTALGILPIALKDRFWSGMGFTIIFGVIAASFLTLFVVKGIYYEIYINEHDKGKWKKLLPWKWSIWQRKRKTKKEV